MRKALLFCFNLKKSAAESQRMLVEAYGDNALSETTCRDWFRRFNDDNLTDKKRENRPKKVEDCQLQALLDEDNTQSQKMFTEQLGVSQAVIFMRLHAMGKVQKIRKWVPHELNETHGATPKQMPHSACQTKKKVLYWIVTGDEK